MLHCITLSIICSTVFSEGSIECDFDETHQCGYIDVSEDDIRWIRSCAELNEYSYGTFVEYVDSMCLTSASEPWPEISVHYST